MKKQIINALIVSNQQIREGIFRLILDCGATAGTAEPCDIESGTAEPCGTESGTAECFDSEPGQFINLYLRDKSMLLPRPISICFSEGRQITLVYRAVGNGTRELAGYNAGDTIQISTPLGQGYRIKALFDTLRQVPSDRKTIALVAGGLGIPPMLELAKKIRERIGIDEKIKLIAILGYQKSSFLAEELGAFCDEIHIAAENGAEGFRGNVIELMEAKQFDADYYLSCGPRPMLEVLAAHCARKGKPLQVSLEERMGCGYGACVGCTCGTKLEKDGFMKVIQKKVCTDGPVFFGEEVIWSA